MATTKVALPPMLARMPNPLPRCGWVDCVDDATTELGMLPPELLEGRTFDEIARTHFEPLCDRHVGFSVGAYNRAGDPGSVIFTRRLVPAPR